MGYKLSNLLKDIENVKVIGDLDNPISRYNVIERMKNINQKSFLVAIDAALSNKNQIGNIVVSNKAMSIGSGLGRRNINIGDISVKGIVSKDLKNPRYNFKMLQNVSLRFNNEYGRFSNKRDL